MLSGRFKVLFGFQDPGFFSIRERTIVALINCLEDEDVVEEFDDALGNFERRVIDFVDLEAVCLRSLYVGVSES